MEPRPGQVLPDLDHEIEAALLDATERFGLWADLHRLDPEPRKAVEAHLRSKGHSIRAIAGVVGSTKDQVAEDTAPNVRDGNRRYPPADEQS